MNSQEKAISDYSPKDECAHVLNFAPVCPYCGYEMTDAWELGDDSYFEVECARCESEYKIDRQVEVSYSTYKTEEVK